MITYLRTGRHIRGTGNIIGNYPDGIVKVKPSREDWGIILVTPAEIEAGKEKPPIAPREKLAEAPDGLKPKAKRQPKPAPVPRWKELVVFARICVTIWPDSEYQNVPTKILRELADELEAAQNLFQPKF